MGKVKKLTKTQVLNRLLATGEWICEVADPIEKKDEGDVYEPHIQEMLDGVDEAYALIQKM